jgi:hypothetical protein
MAEEHQVHIVSWPPEPARLEHHFPQEQNIPVSVSFDGTPAHVVIAALRENPLAVNMAMNLRAPETLPLCIRLCEPICVESAYTIGISIFDRPVITITLRGKTRLFGCREEL